jgi:hypothetical protein
VSEEIEGTRYNTAISAMMEFINAAYKVYSIGFRAFLDSIQIVNHDNM